MVLLLLSPNFDVIKVYNKLLKLCAGVSLLGRGIIGQPGISKIMATLRKTAYQLSSS